MRESMLPKRSEKTTSCRIIGPNDRSRTFGRGGGAYSGYREGGARASKGGVGRWSARLVSWWLFPVGGRECNGNLGSHGARVESSDPVVETGVLAASARRARGPSAGPVAAVGSSSADC